ncbi:4-hydroxy-tetrahydrodipicolinate reductase [Sporosarcina ureilytica]|uniref:4-hydroxy-tetrahydrodipicolinate reductase n=1 Tax=Sporosarcina ureilytica TaxID=298596 RepID=A0A1D8JH70_9BACL|nr:4-hydroxy-tetrahydrodipicolinate reductase [Sporosarcina ureilytica]AOV08051.1 4-hydroxy-tetrahydrodipicolinate reductase [Sporosarcina ureilytica]
MTIKIVLAGARGRMGSAAIEAINKIEDMEIVAALDYKNDGLFLHENKVHDTEIGIPIFTSFDRLIKHVQPDVLLDLTTPDVVYENMYNAIKNGIRPVVGTSGLSFDEIEKLTEFANEKEIGGIIAPNFSIGAVLMMKFSAMAARYLGDIEIIESHHNQKVDAPSGTAMKTAEMIMNVREAHIQGHEEEKEHVKGARGADIEGMKIHSIRLPGLLAHQEVLLGAEGELLTLRHDSFNRSCFMPGVLMAIRNVLVRKDLVYGLENILD